jgi:hypothetical protein
MTFATTCRACRLLITAGEALRVTPTDGRLSFHVHRPSVDLRCFKAAGCAGQASIALADPEAADEFDHRQGGPPKWAARSEGVPAWASPTRRP